MRGYSKIQYGGMKWSPSCLSLFVDESLNLLWKYHLERPIHDENNSMLTWGLKGDVYNQEQLE